MIYTECYHIRPGWFATIIHHRRRHHSYHPLARSVASEFAHFIFLFASWKKVDIGGWLHGPFRIHTFTSTECQSIQSFSCRKIAHIQHPSPKYTRCYFHYVSDTHTVPLPFSIIVFRWRDIHFCCVVSINPWYSSVVVANTPTCSSRIVASHTRLHHLIIAIHRYRSTRFSSHSLFLALLYQARFSHDFFFRCRSFEVIARARFEMWLQR